MGHIKRHGLVLFVLMGRMIPTDAIGAAKADAQSKRPTSAQVLSKLLPLPDSVPRTIMNPYHADPAWKLWAQDPLPVVLNTPQFKGTFTLPKVQRKVPVFVLKRGVKELVLEPLKSNRMAGFWDDCYVSLDNHHTRLRTPKDQFIDGGKMRTAQDVQTLLALGANFTSQSYADRGRAIVDDVFNTLNTERHFFFANCIRATPAHISYRDVDKDKVTDLYDGLFAHSYQSVGQSGSEVYALYKMMVAGACMPRSTKDLLKKHGAYAIVLLTIFKAALPYTDAQGHPLPYEHELRHRPAYSSHGTPAHVHYCPANAHYHGYDDTRHLQAMMALARDLALAPPVAVADLQGFAVTKGGKRSTDQAQMTQRTKCISMTNMRFWGERGETLEVRINLNKSYDLQAHPLSFTCQALYPNQRNVTIREEAPGVYLLRVTHYPDLPKGRIPIICTASNGLTVPSNPVFINFYWPDENEVSDYFSTRGLSDDNRRQINAQGLRRLPVNINRRPQVDLGFTGDALRCVPGQTVSFPLKAHDPEHFPVTVYRRPGEIGTIENNRFTAHIPKTDREKIYRVHLIFSDGTGGYTGKQIKLLVGKEPDVLPEEWGISALGPMPRAVNVTYDNQTFTFAKQPFNRQAGLLEGTFVFRQVPRQTDLVYRIPTVSGGANLALMVTNTLDGYSRRAGIGSFQGGISGVVKSDERSRAERVFQWDRTRADKPDYMRLTLRDGKVAGYLSVDNQTWEQVMVRNMTFFKQCFAGLIYHGDPWATGTCQMLTPPETALPILTTDKNSPDQEGHYEGPLEITVSSPNTHSVICYTRDGSNPSEQSQIYKNPIELIKAGRHEIRAKAFQNGVAQGTVVAVYRLKE